MNTLIIPNRDLLDPSFESYKLSLKPTRTTSIDLDEGIVLDSVFILEMDIKSLKPNNFSRLQIELSSIHNCLFQDRFKPKQLFYSTKSGHVKSVLILDENEHLSVGPTVFTFPVKVPAKEVDICNTSMVFTPEYAVVLDGIRSLYLLSTPNRTESHASPWNVVLKLDVDIASESAFLVDAIQTNNSETSPQIDCVLLSVYRPETEKRCVHLDWVTLSQSQGTYVLSRHRRLTCAALPDYVVFEGNASSLTVRAAQPLIPTFDSANPDIKPPSPVSTDTPMDPDQTDRCRITWTQSLPTMSEADSCMLNILIKLPREKIPSDPKSSIKVTCTPCPPAEGDLMFYRIEVKLDILSGGQELVNARLFAPIKPADTMWTYDPETNSLDITLVKDTALTWPRLLADGDEERCLRIRYDDAAMLGGGASVDDLGGANPPVASEPMQSCFNVEQLEDVDMVNETEDGFDAIIQRIDGETLQATHRAEMLGHQLLYTPLGTPPCPSSRLLCTRHDVDGLLWCPSPSSSQSPWRHVATLQAFGYVLASKQNRRFVASPPSDDAVCPAFVAVADISKHVYVYWQPAPSSDGLTELRHRHSKVVHVAWQQVISLPFGEGEVKGDPEVVGFAAVKNYVVVATRKQLHLVALSEEL